MVLNESFQPVPYDRDAIAAGGFAAFYPFYLGEHANRTNRRLHLLGTTLAVMLAGGALVARTPLLLAGAVLCGYGCAWVGHYVFEGNRPATFKHPLLSLAGDFKLWSEVVSGQRAF